MWRVSFVDYLILAKLTTFTERYIYKGRKFNARKETTDEKYYAIAIYRFYIRCTRCSAEITFKTNPKEMDYTCERGAKRNFEPWRASGESNKVETEEEILDRLEAEEAAQGGAMEQLEAKVVDAKREMDIADALDEIRTRNARIQRAEGKSEMDTALEVAERKRQQAEEEQRSLEAADAEEARKAFARGVIDGEADNAKIDDGDRDVGPNLDIPSSSSMPPPTFRKTVKKKKEAGGLLGLKKKATLV